MLAGYFSRTAASLHSKHPAEVADYLLQCGQEAVLNRFLNHLHLRSVAELYARLLCVEDSGQLVFPKEGLVARMLACLEEDRGSVGDLQENIVLIFGDLLGQKDSFYFGEEVLAQLSSASVIDTLVGHVCRGKARVASAAVAILSSVVFYTC